MSNLNKLIPKKEAEKKKVPLLQRQSWPISALLVMMVYVILVITVKLHVEDPGYLLKAIHTLPVIAVIMLVLGYFDKKKKEREEAERKARRYKARLEISRIERENKSAGSSDGGQGGQ